MSFTGYWPLHCPPSCVHCFPPPRFTYVLQCLHIKCSVFISNAVSSYQMQCLHIKCSVFISNAVSSYQMQCLHIKISLRNDPCLNHNVSILSMHPWTLPPSLCQSMVTCTCLQTDEMISFLIPFPLPEHCTSAQSCREVCLFTYSS